MCAKGYFPFAFISGGKTVLSISNMVKGLNRLIRLYDNSKSGSIRTSCGYSEFILNEISASRTPQRYYTFVSTVMVV
jgi:hypothetical protein